MRQEPIPVRGLVLALCAGLIGGCATGERRANHDWNRVGEGITREDVVSLVGQGDVRLRPDGTEIWHYSYGSAPDAKKIGAFTGEVLFALTVLGLLVLLAAASRGGFPDNRDSKPLITDPPEITAARVHFRVVFDRTGRVVELSGLEPCED